MLFNNFPCIKCFPDLTTRPICSKAGRGDDHVSLVIKLYQLCSSLSKNCKIQQESLHMNSNIQLKPQMGVSSGFYYDKL